MPRINRSAYRYCSANNAHCKNSTDACCNSFGLFSMIVPNVGNISELDIPIRGALEAATPTAYNHAIDDDHSDAVATVNIERIRRNKKGGQLKVILGVKSYKPLSNRRILTRLSVGGKGGKERRTNR